MPRVRKLVTPQVDDQLEQIDFLPDEPIVEGDESTPLPEGYIVDVISGTKPLRETPKEQVRQRIARALHHEDGISYEDMEADFPATIDGKRRRIDIGIFHASN